MRAAIVAEGLPCVWLVEVGAAPPNDWTDSEDWVRLPADEEEIAARIAGVESRSRMLMSSAWIDEFDVLRNGDSWVALSPLEARLMRELLAHERAVVRRDDLVDVAWPSATAARAMDLNKPMRLLRRKASSIGIEIHTVAGRGYLAEAVVSGPGSSAG
jgi:DNA-binding response OmpR family regulator